MYQIGEFSKITNLTIKALRYYDEQEILKPSYRGENKYRLYQESDFEKAQLILFLKKLEFSIAELKEVVDNCQDEGDLQYFLEKKKASIVKKILKEKSLMKTIDRYLLNKIVEGNSMSYEIVKKEMAPVKVASIRYQGAYRDVGDYIGLIYKEVKGKSAGAPFNCYYDGEFKEVADIEICVPIEDGVIAHKATIKQFPKIMALCTTHIGSYETLNLAYKAIVDYAIENGIECDLPSREIYHKGPGMVFRGNPEKYETEIVMPIKQ